MLVELKRKRGRPRKVQPDPDRILSSGLAALVNAKIPKPAITSPPTLIQQYSLEQVEAEMDRRNRNRLMTWFPDTGPFRRELYPKHIEFMKAGRIHKERLAMMANRCGKSLMGGLEMTFHATGLYPHWWEGRVFEEPVTCWALNKTSFDCRDINQQVLLGEPGQHGTGMIPAHLLIDTKPRHSIPHAVEIIYVRHRTGGQSVIYLKAYESGREKFQGRAIHVIWADEEIPADIYSECLMRIMTTEGIIYCTFTPLLGLTPVTMDFLTNAVNKDELPIKFNNKQNIPANNLTM